MSHHNNIDPTSCPLCEEKLAEAHPRLSEWFRKCVKSEHPDCHIAWSFRDEESQEEACREGKSKLHYPHSAHNKTGEDGKPRAEALDLFQLAEDGHAIFNPLFYAKLAADNDDNKRVYIFWGGRWKHLGDNDHFQLNLSVSP